MTPLHKAAMNGLEATCRILIEGGDKYIQGSATLYMKDKKGNTPLYYAKRRGHTTIASLLVEQNAANIIECEHGGLKAVPTCIKGFECNICEQEFDKGTELQSCRMCDVDVCANCYKEDFLETKAAETNAMGNTLRRLVESDHTSDVQDDSGTPIITIASIVSAALLLSTYAIYLLKKHLRKRQPAPELATIIIE